MKRPKPTDLAWFAGLMEGEGCFSARMTKNDRPRVSVQLAMTDQDVVMKARNLFPGVGSLGFHSRVHLSNKDVWTWSIDRRSDVMYVLKMLHPFMGTRRQAKIEECLQLYLDNPPAHNRNKTHCPQGHEYTPENTYIDSRCDRQCHTCKKKQESAHYHRKKAARTS